MSHQTWIYDPEKKSSSGEKVKLWSFTPLEFKGSIHLLPTWMLKILWIFFDSHIILIKVGNLSPLLKGWKKKMHTYSNLNQIRLTCHCQKRPLAASINWHIMWWFSYISIQRCQLGAYILHYFLYYTWHLFNNKAKGIWVEVLRDGKSSLYVKI